MSSSWMGDMADAQDAMENDQMHTDEVAAQPDTNPRSMEFAVLQNSIQQCENMIQQIAQAERQQWQ